MNPTATAPADPTPALTRAAAVHIGQRGVELRTIASALQRYALAAGEVGRLSALVERGVADDLERTVDAQDQELADLIVTIFPPPLRGVLQPILATNLHAPNPNA